MQQKDIEFSSEYDEIYLGKSIKITYHIVPETHDYFSDDRALRVEVTTETKARERLYLIRRDLSFAGNEDSPDKQDPNFDRAWKIRPSIAQLNAAFQIAKMVLFEKKTIDETVYER